MKTRTKIGGLIFAATLFFAQGAFANLVNGAYLGTFSGNDSEQVLINELGFADIELIARVDSPDSNNMGLDIVIDVTNDDNEGLSGSWSYSGSEIVNLIVIKAGNQFAVYFFDNAITGGMPNVGLWDTSDLNNKGVSHIAGYSVNAPVPLPAAAWLFISALLGLGLTGRKRLA